MSSSSSFSSTLCCPEFTALFKPVYESFTIINTNRKIFLSIFTLITLPLSLLIFSLISLSSPIKDQISLKAALAVETHTRMESGMIWEEIQSDVLTLIHLKTLYFFPSYALALLATVTAVDTAALAVSGESPSFKTALSAIRISWKRPLVTLICVYALICAYDLMVFVIASSSYLMGTSSLTSIATTTSSWPAKWVMVVVFRAVLEVYLAAVLSMGVVVSVAEERFGWEAVREGWVLVGEKRFSGWGLAGFLMLVSGGVLWGFEMMRVVDGQDLMGVVCKVGLVCFFGLVVVWSCVVNTVFYFECRKHHVHRMEVQHSV